METALVKRTATVATTRDMSMSANDEDGYAEGFDFTDDDLDACATAANCEVVEASTTKCTLRNSLMKYGNKAKKAILDELQGVLDRQVWEPCQDHELTKDQRRRPLHKKWVINENETPEGVFERVKARMVVLGNLQTDDQLTTSTRSLTSSFHSIFLSDSNCCSTR